MTACSTYRLSLNCWRYTNKLPTVPVSRPLLKETNRGPKMVYYKLVFWTWYLPLKILYSVDQDAQEFLAVCSGVVTYIEWVAGTFPFNKSDCLRFSTIEAVDLVYMPRVNYQHIYSP